MGLRVNRYSWWTHARELADYFLPRRYKWIITPNQAYRGSPINQHILDETGVICARNLASGLVSGKSSPTRPWFKLRVGKIDSTQTSPVSLWLAECERLLYLIFSESNFYNCIATFYFDLVIFGTAVLLIYEDYDNVINCYNPCFGEYYVDIDGQYRPRIFYREFTMTVDAVVNRWGRENCSASCLALYDDPSGANRTREIIVAHAVEPLTPGDAERFDISPKWSFWEVYWEWGGSTSPQGGAPGQGPGFLYIGGFHEQMAIIGRWDLVSNDAYGRSVAMDGLPTQKQVQLEQRRKAQAIDKMVNPPLVADMQLKNQPASLLPGGITYVSGYTTSGKPGFSSVYDTKFPVGEITEDLKECYTRLGKIFFNDVLMTASQFETRSNVTAMEWDMRRAESMVLLGPALERIDYEVLGPAIDRVFAIASRIPGFLPPAPSEIAGQMITVDYVSMLSQSQQAAAAGGIERVAQFAGTLEGIKPGTMDNIDTDFMIEKYSKLLQNDPKMIRSPEQLAAIRQAAAQQQQQMQQAAMAEQLSKSAKNMADANIGNGQPAAQQIGVQ
jgi:hypothetical protein